jgi:hypothetical protein
VYLALHKVKDQAMALEVAEPLKGVRGIPAWAQQMPAFVHEKRGEFEDAYRIMTNILEHEDTLDQGELNYIRYFLKERVERLEEAEAMLKAREEALQQQETGGQAPETAPERGSE